MPLLGLGEGTQVSSGISRVLGIALMQDVLLYSAGIIDHMASGVAGAEGSQRRRNKSYDRSRGGGRDSPCWSGGQGTPGDRGLNVGDVRRGWDKSWGRGQGGGWGGN